MKSRNLKINSILKLTMGNNKDLSPQNQEVLAEYIKSAESVGLVINAEVIGNGYDMIIKSFKLSDEEENGKKQLIAECVVKGHEEAGVTSFYANQIYAKSFFKAKIRQTIVETINGAILEAKKMSLKPKETEMLLLQQIGRLGFMMNGKVRTKDDTKRKITGFRYADDTLYVASSMSGNDSLGSLEHDVRELTPVKSLISQYVQPIRIDMQCDECEDGFMRPKEKHPDGGLIHQCNNQNCRRTEIYNQKFPYITYEAVDG